MFNMNFNILIKLKNLNWVVWIFTKNKKIKKIYQNKIIKMVIEKDIDKKNAAIIFILDEESPLKLDQIG